MRGEICALLAWGGAFQADGISQISGIASRLGVIRADPWLADKCKLTDATVWIVEDDRRPWNRLEHERWVVDAGPGRHLIVSVGSIDSGLESLLPPHIKFLNRSQSMALLGEAIVVGFRPNDPSTHLSSEAVIGQQKPKSTVFSTKGGSDRNFDTPLSLKPLVDIDQLLASMGHGNVTPKPCLLIARAWRVRGTLQGPISVEDIDGLLLDSGPSRPLLVIDTSSLLEWIPKLDRLSISNLRGEMELRAELPNFFDDRRTHDDRLEDGIRARVLRWRFDSDSARLDPIDALVPAWVVDVPNKGLNVINGLDGRRFPSILSSGLH